MKRKTKYFKAIALGFCVYVLIAFSQGQVMVVHSGDETEEFTLGEIDSISFTYKSLPKKPGQISCNSFYTSDPIKFSVAPVEDAIAYIWKVSGPADWIIAGIGNSVSTIIPDQPGQYRISVASVGKSGISAFSLFDIGVQLKEETQDVPQNVFDLISEPEPFLEAEESLLNVETVPGTEKSYTNTEEIEGVIYTTTWRCVTKRYSATENPDQFFMFNPLASVLWPGNLVQGKSIASGVPTSIPISKRKPGNISFAIVSPDKLGVVNMYYRTVDKMQFSYVNQAMNEVLAGFGGHGYAKYNFEMDFVESASDFNFKLRAGYSGGPVKASSAFGINWNDKKTRILVKLTQQYYTMVYDDPEGINGVFTPDITANDLRNYSGNGNPVCYISSVTYGRVYFLVYESTASKQELNAAVNFAYNKIGSAYVNTEAQYNKVMSNTSVRIMQIGGNAADGLNSATAPNLSTIQTFLDRGANFSPQSPGAPISYTIKYLKDASLVRMNNTMEYEVEQCEPEAVDSTDTKSTVGIKINDYKADVTHSDAWNHCYHRFAVDIGEINNATGGTEILVRYPENSTFVNYGSAKNASYAINFDAGKVRITKGNTLYVRFRLSNETQRSRLDTWGRVTRYQGTINYEKTIYFDYVPAENRWVAREDNGHFRSVTIISPTVNTFRITNTINYSIVIE